MKLKNIFKQLTSLVLTATIPLSVSFTATASEKTEYMQ